MIQYNKQENRKNIPGKILQKMQRLKIDKDYVFRHAKKGEFRGTFKGRENADANDLQDDFFLIVLIDTSPETGKPQLARVKKVQTTLTNIRPSHILDIGDAPAYKPPPGQVIAVPPKERESVLDILKKLFKRRKNSHIGG